MLLRAQLVFLCHKRIKEGLRPLSIQNLQEKHKQHLFPLCNRAKGG